MDNKSTQEFAEEMVREYLVFRGFTNTLQSLEKELSTDIGRRFQADKIIDLIFRTYVPRFEADKIIDLFNFFQRRFSSSLTDDAATFITILSKIEQSVLRYYIVHAVRCGRKDMVVELFRVLGNELRNRDEKWSSWFAIPYLENPHLEPEYQVYFSEEWFRALHLSVTNFFSEIFNGTNILHCSYRVLFSYHEGLDQFFMNKICCRGEKDNKLIGGNGGSSMVCSQKDTVSRLKKEIKQLNLRIAQMQTLLDEKDEAYRYSRSGSSLMEIGARGTSSSCPSIAGVAEESLCARSASDDVCEHAVSETEERELFRDSNEAQFVEPNGPEAKINTQTDESGREDSIQMSQNDSVNGSGHNPCMEEEFPEVRTAFQDTFLGHTGLITCCRFSASGDNIASASMDGTVRIWTYKSSASTSRNATIYCGAEIMSLEWDCKSDRLLLIGTADGGIKAWNVDAKRVVCDLNSTVSFPSVVDLKCSPVEPIFVSAAASKRQGSSYIDKLGFGSLTVWNMRTWKEMTVLPLGKDPPAITSLSFNHNGKLLAAGAADGMIHMFDMSAGLQVTGWPAHDSAISTVLFGPDETNIFSLGIDGNILEWSLHNQGKILWSRNCSGFCNPEHSLQFRHHMALDSDGRRILVTSNSQRAPIYQVRGHMSGMRTLAHSGSITTVDWHPTLPIFLTGSADHSIRVTSIT